MSQAGSRGSARAEAPLYSRILGTLWETLPPVVREMHSPPIQAQGRFLIRRGRGFARLLGSLMGLPRSGEDVLVTLGVDRCGDSERWRRLMGQSRLDTVQTMGPDGTLVERFGMLDFVFRLRSSKGALEYEQVRASVALGRIRMPLPERAAPQVAAREEALPDSSGTRVTVEISSPLVGLLVRYQGAVRRIEEA